MNEEVSPAKLPEDSPPDKDRSRTDAMKNVDEMFKDRATVAVESSGFEVLDLLSNHPGVPITELIKVLNRKSNAIGFIIAAYEAAEKTGVVRDVAFDLLTRYILEGFPNGWDSNGTIHPVVKLVGWLSSVKNYTKNPQDANFARRIMETLAVTNPPANGWIPEIRNDPLLKETFDNCWPP
ncbi:MAG: hypothetical protein JWM11_6264 [Planctomycetaceae bacterium]|nr:hypothetical protein [Planctomycetaceae bacterium]